MTVVFQLFTESYETRNPREFLCFRWSLDDIVYSDETCGMRDDILSDPEVKDLLAELEEHHEESYKHSKRVGLLALELGLENNVGGERLESLGYGAFLHDVGKAEIPLYVLDSGEELTPQERTLIDRHAAIGRNKLEEIGFDETVYDIAEYHHGFKLDSDVDGSEMEDPELVQIVAAADVYDAVTYARCYKDSMSFEEAERIMSEDHTFDEGVIEQVGAIT